MKKTLFIFLFCSIGANAQIITTVAGTGIRGYSGDGGPATNAELIFPTRIALDISGNIYMINEFNRIRKIDAITGIISTVAGNGTNYTGGRCDTVGNGTFATATTFSPIALVATDNNGDFYTTCQSSAKKITVGTGIIDTILSNITARNIIFDKNNNMYIETVWNIYKKDAVTGTITLIAGSGMSSAIWGNGGPATAASLGGYIGGIAIDTSGNLYVAGTNSNTVRKIDLNTNIISAFAGTGSIGYSGDGFNATGAQLNNPEAIGVDKYGNVYIADNGNNVIRKVDKATGIISTIAGTYIPGYSGDGGPAIIAQLNHPTDVKVDTSGNIFIADWENNRIRKITPSTVSVNNIQVKSEIVLYPNPAQNKLTVVAKNKINEVTIANLLGQAIYTQKYASDKAEVDLADLPAGMYLVKINGTEVRKFVKR